MKSKNVILYVRVSTDEQANRGYSLRDQEQKLLSYCSLQNYNVIDVYREDYSAKTFNRPQFKKMLEYCKKNKKDIHKVLFMKWDRFSRNTSQSYQMIETFRNFAIDVNAIEQPLDLDVPENGLMLAVYLSMPEVENQRRSLNVIAGMRRALKEGRYVGNAPKGYSNGEDSLKRPLIIPNDDALLVKEAFELLASGLYNQVEVFKKVKAKGLKTSKTAMSSVYRNHLYYGGIFIKGYKDEKERIVEGIHEPIISKELFNKVQNVLDGKKNIFKMTPKKTNDRFPLKGFLMCPECKKPLTASTSRGKGGHYSYYHCISPCNIRYKLENVEYWFNDFLRSIQLNKPVQKLFLEIIKEKLDFFKSTPEIGPKHYETKAKLEEKILKLHDKYIEGDIEKTIYNKLLTRYEEEQDFITEKESVLHDKKESITIVEKALNRIGNIENEYINSELEDKIKLVSSIFPNKFHLESYGVRTQDINPLLLKISRINGLSQESKKKDKTLKKILSCMVGDEGFEPPTPSV